MLRRLKLDPAIATHSITLLKAKQILAPRVGKWLESQRHQHYRPGRVFIASGTLTVVHSPLLVFSYEFSVQPWDFLCMYFQVLGKGLKLLNPIFKLKYVLNWWFSRPASHGFITLTADITHYIK